MRYYGEATATTRCAGARNAQVTFDDFLHAAFGAVLNIWSYRELDIQTCMKIIIRLAKSSEKLQARESRPGRAEWLESFTKILERLISMLSADREQYRKLTCFGMRIFCSFFEGTDRPCLIFVLANIQLLLETIVAWKIRLLSCRNGVKCRA